MQEDPARIRIEQADITRLGLDAIVNAANERLAPGGGVCGAIHRAAGPDLAAECAAIGRCPTGEARITRGYDLPARYVIHTVGPVWHGGGRGEDVLLAACYRSSLDLACEHDLRSIAFPAISTGQSNSKATFPYRNPPAFDQSFGDNHTTRMRSVLSRLSS